VAQDAVEALFLYFQRTLLKVKSFFEVNQQSVVDFEVKNELMTNFFQFSILIMFILKLLNY